MFGGMRRSTCVSGDGSPPSVLEIVKPKPIVVDAPSRSGVNDACSLTASDACAGEGRHPRRSNASAANAALVRHFAADMHRYRVAGAVNGAAEAQARAFGFRIAAGSPGYVQGTRERRARGGDHAIGRSRARRDRPTAWVDLDLRGHR